MQFQMKITERNGILTPQLLLMKEIRNLFWFCQILASLIELQENPRNFNPTEITTNQVDKMVPLS